jgi:hypothetical protein
VVSHTQRLFVISETNGIEEESKNKEVSGKTHIGIGIYSVGPETLCCFFFFLFQSLPLSCCTLIDIRTIAAEGERQQRQDRKAVVILSAVVGRRPGQLKLFCLLLFVLIISHGDFLITHGKREGPFCRKIK